MYWKISRKSKSAGFSTRMPQNGGCGMFGGAGISIFGVVGAFAVAEPATAAVANSFTTLPSAMRFSRAPFGVDRSSIRCSPANASSA